MASGKSMEMGGVSGVISSTFGRSNSSRGIFLLPGGRFLGERFGFCLATFDGGVGATMRSSTTISSPIDSELEDVTSSGLYRCSGMCGVCSVSSFWMLIVRRSEEEEEDGYSCFSSMALRNVTSKMFSSNRPTSSRLRISREGVGVLSTRTEGGGD